jgi:hypothetical protein
VQLRAAGFHIHVGSLWAVLGKQLRLELDSQSVLGRCAFAGSVPLIPLQVLPKIDARIIGFLFLICKKVNQYGLDRDYKNRRVLSFLINKRATLVKVAGCLR